MFSQLFCSITHFCPISLVYFQIRVIYQFSIQFPPNIYLVHKILLIYVVIGDSAIHLSHSYEELKQSIWSSLFHNFLLHGNRIHSPAIMIINDVLVAIVVRTDLRVEELVDCFQTGCMTKQMGLILSSPLSAAVGIHE